MTETVQIILAVGGVAAAITAIVALVLLAVRPLRRLARQQDEFREDWYGAAARPGRDAVPGVPERLRSIEKELRPNGGGSMRDALVRVEQRLDDHVRSCNSGS